MHWFDRLMEWLFPRRETWDEAAARCLVFENDAMHEYHAIVSSGEDPDSPRAREKRLEATSWARRRRVFEQQARRSR